MDRRSLFTLAGSATLLSLAASCAAGSGASVTPSASPTAKRAVIGLTYIPNIQFAPFYVAEQGGLFAAVGAEVSLRHHGASEGLFTAITAGQEDFVIAGGDELLQARAEGIDLVAIAAFYHAYPVAVLVKDASPIGDLTELRGRKIGVPGRYGETWFALLVALRAAGLAESDVTIVEIGYTQQAALSTDKVDAVMGFVNNDRVQFELAGIATRAIPIADEVPLVPICLATTRTYLDANPLVATKVADAMVAGIASTVADPNAAMAAAADYIPGLSQDAAQRGARATLVATTPLWRDAAGAVSGALTPDHWDRMATFMAEVGLTKTAVAAASAYDTGHVTR